MLLDGRSAVPAGRTREMNDALVLLWVVLGTVAVTVFVVIAGALVITLLDLRRTSRSVRETLERVAPAAEETAENVREVSGAARDAVRGLKTAGDALSTVRRSGARIAPWLPLLLGVAGAVSALRGRRGRDDDANEGDGTRRGRRRSSRR
ncbi:MAG: hypothetical protein Kow0062_20020 [Acidobacteriota bacterium]